MKWKLLSVILFSFLSLWIIPHVAFAAPITTPTQASPINTYLQDPKAQEELHVGTQAVMIEILSSITCQLAGVDPIKPSGKCLGIDQKNGMLGYVESNGGAIGLMSTAIAGTFQIPVSTHTYVSDLASHFGVAKHSYAAQVDIGGDGSGSTSTFGGDTGTGFSGLFPFLRIWQAFRNIVYIFFVILMLLVGLGIMFRIKVDARTVMSIQNSLPKLVIGLVLITFSYAIVGILIDFMWVACYLIYEIMATAGIPNFDPSQFNPNLLQQQTPFASMNGFGGIGHIAGSVSSSIGGVITSLFDGKIGNIIGGIIGATLGGLLGKAIPGANLTGGLVGGLVGGILGAVAGSKLLGLFATIITFVIVAVAILASLFRLWFSLIKSYVYILLALILGPFWIALGVLPGGKVGFGSWFRDVLANLAVFPATIFMLMLGSAIVDSVGRTQRTGQFVPPLIGNPGEASQIGGIIGMGFLLLTPQVVTIVRDALKAPANKYSAAIGQSFAGAAGIPFGSVRSGAGIYAGRGEAVGKAGKDKTIEYKPRGIMGGIRQRFLGH